MAVLCIRLIFPFRIIFWAPQIMQTLTRLSIGASYGRILNCNSVARFFFWPFVLFVKHRSASVVSSPWFGIFIAFVAVKTRSKSNVTALNRIQKTSRFRLGFWLMAITAFSVTENQIRIFIGNIASFLTTELRAIFVIGIFNSDFQLVFMLTADEVDSYWPNCEYFFGDHLLFRKFRLFAK